MLGANYYGSNRDDAWFLDRASAETKISWWPRRCQSSQQWIWGRATRARRVITGPGDPVIEDRWYDQHQYLMLIMSKS